MITYSPGPGRKGAFTLVELLMVMAIMLVILGLVVINYPNIGKAGNLTNGAANFADMLNQARQSALALNRSVEVRFYYLPGSGVTRVLSLPREQTKTAFNGENDKYCVLFNEEQST